MDNKLPENVTPIRYQPSFEQPAPDENSLIKQILKTIADVREKPTRIQVMRSAVCM